MANARLSFWFDSQSTVTGIPAQSKKSRLAQEQWNTLADVLARPDADQDEAAIAGLLDAVFSLPEKPVRSKIGKTAGSQKAAKKAPHALCKSTPAKAPAGGPHLVICKSENPNPNPDRAQSQSSITTAPILTKRKRSPSAKAIKHHAKHNPRTYGYTRPTKGMRPYRYLTPEGLLHTTHEHLLTLGEIIDFTIDLRDDIAGKAIASKQPARYVWKRLGQLLKAAGLPTLVWGALENKDGLWHFHGAAQCPHDRLANWRACANKAAGKWHAPDRTIGERERRHLQTIARPNPNAGWGDYSLKEAPLSAIVTDMFGPGDKTFAQMPFEGRPWFVSEELQRSTKAAYEAKRQEQFRANEEHRSVNTDLNEDKLDKAQQISDSHPARTSPDTREKTHELPRHKRRGLRTSDDRAAQPRPIRNSGRIGGDSLGLSSPLRIDGLDPRRRALRVDYTGAAPPCTGPPRPP